MPANKTALCIGINNYPGTSSDLSGCVNDAKDWAAALAQRGFATSLLLDSKATGAAMRAAMQDLVQSAQAGDTVIITYSGHGSFVPDDNGDEADGTDECLCPHDVATKGPITDDQLYEIYTQKARGVRVVMISDSCHSGTVAKFARISTPPTERSKKPPTRLVRFLPPGAFESRKQMRKLGTRRAIWRSSSPGRHGALLMSGCQDVEYSYDAWFNGRPNGAFTFVALRELKALKPTATYAEWFKRIRAALPSQQYPQSPNLYGSSRMKRWRILGSAKANGSANGSAKANGRSKANENAKANGSAKANGKRRR